MSNIFQLSLHFASAGGFHKLIKILMGAIQDSALPSDKT
jgi:hypothetical protein